MTYKCGEKHCNKQLNTVCNESRQPWEEENYTHTHVNESVFDCVCA